MKKVIFVTHTLLAGGAEKVLVNLIEKMDKSKYDITVMTIVNDGVYIEEIKKIEGVKYKYIFNAFFKKQRAERGYKNNNIYFKIMNIIWKIYNKILKYTSNKLIHKIHIGNKYDVEISFLEGKPAKLVSSSQNKKSKKIAWIHTDLINFNKSSSAFKNEIEENNCYSKFDEIVCVSEEVKNQFTKKTNINKNVKIIHNIIDMNEIKQKAKEKVTDIKKPNNLLICTIGRLIHEKGYDRLLEVCKKLRAEGHKYTLWIIGEGYQREQLEKYIAKNKLGNTVKLLGYKNNPYKYLKMADIFVCSSRVEGLSTVISEAITLEKVIVTTKCPGVSEILGKDNSFACVTKNNKEDLYQGLKKVLEDTELYKMYSNNIIKKKELLNENNIMEKIEEIINKNSKGMK